MHPATNPQFRASRLGWLLAITCTLALAAPCALAQRAIPQPHPTAQLQADRATMRNFPLNMGVVRRLAATVEAVNSEHLPCTNSNTGDGGSIDAMVHTLVTKYPRAVPLLAEHGFTPREFVIARLSLVHTGLAADMMSHPGSPFAQAFEKGHGHYNAKNVAFFNAHRAEIMAMMKKMNSGSSCGD